MNADQQYRCKGVLFSEKDDADVRAKQMKLKQISLIYFSQPLHQIKSDCPQRAVHQQQVSVIKYF